MLTISIRLRRRRQIGDWLLESVGPHLPPGKAGLRQVHKGRFATDPNNIDGATQGSESQRMTVPSAKCRSCRQFRPV
jgi:hypothetical protein